MAPPAEQWSRIIPWCVTIYQHNPYNKVTNTKDGDILIIDFDEQRFRTEIINMVRPFGLSKREIKQVVEYALQAVRRSSTPARFSPSDPDEFYM